MYYEDMDPTIKSQFIHSTHSLANLVSESQMPIYGLKASEVLNTGQMAALRAIREKKLTGRQKKQFH